MSDVSPDFAPGITAVVEMVVGVVVLGGALWWAGIRRTNKLGRWRRP